MVAGLVLLSAFLHALWNAILKTRPDKDVAGVAVIGVAEVAAVVTATGVWCVSSAAPFTTATGLAWSAGAGLCEALYFGLLVAALERAPLAVAYTVSRGVAILTVWPLSVAWLGEPISARAVAGTALLCAGLATSGIERGSAARGLVVASLCGLAVAGYHLAYKQALATGAQPAAVFAVSLAIAFPVNLARLGPRRAALGAALRARPWGLVGLGAICAASFLIFLFALGRGGAGFVLTLRNTSIVFAALIGRTLGEVPTRRQLAGAVLVAGGAILVGLSR